MAGDIISEFACSADHIKEVLCCSFFFFFVCLTKTYLYNFDPLKPHFYIVKLGFTGVYIEAVLTTTHNLCFVQIYEKYQNFLSEIFHFLVVKYTILLYRRVFVMVHRSAGHAHKIHLIHIIKTYFVTAIYSRTSTARTSLGPWKCVRDMGSSSHWGLIMVPSQKVNVDNLGIFFFVFSTK